MMEVDTRMADLNFNQVVEHYHRALSEFFKGNPEPAKNVVALMTHLATADSDPGFAEQQLERFRAATDRYRVAGHGQIPAPIPVKRDRPLESDSEPVGS